MRTRVCFLVCTFLVFQLVSGSKTEWIRGVAPVEQQIYKADLFKCKSDPSKVIPSNRVNDNYCDCADGSDEPGTPACVNGLFYCLNKGYKGETIFSSQVNDGICDCCDGSDEYEHKAKCHNKCDELGAELRRQQQEEKDKLEQGLKIKQQYITDAAKALAEKREDIDRFKAEIDKLKKVVEDLEAEKKGFEEREKAERDVMAEKKKELERLEEEKRQQEAPAPSEAEEQANLKDLIQQQEENPQTPPQEGEAPVPLEETPPATPEPEEESEALKTILEGKKKIEDDLSQARRDLSTAESNFKSTEDILKMDFGTNSEFYPLNGNCYEAKTREYTYSFCPFGEVKQAHTSLGRFEKWDPAYSVMSHTNGLQCWGGPKRSAKVTMVCGKDNILSDVAEPAKCEYTMKFATPAACSASHSEFLEHFGGAGHHEENYHP